MVYRVQFSARKEDRCDPNDYSFYMENNVDDINERYETHLLITHDDTHKETKMARKQI